MVRWGRGGGGSVEREEEGRIVGRKRKREGKKGEETKETKKEGMLVGK